MVGVETNKRKVKNNLIYGIVGQILVLLISIIIPRLVILSFGSDMNGLVSSIAQIFMYIALLEAGIGNASLNLLYKYIAKDDKKGINSALSATQCYFRKLMPLYISAIIIFVLVYPMVVKSEVDFWIIRVIIILQGLAGIINFYCTNTIIQFLLADGRNYVIMNLNLFQKIISTSLQILLIVNGFDIIAIQVMQLLMVFFYALAVNIYVRKKYSWLKIKNYGDITILSQRGAFAIHELSNVIFQSTDVFVISTFCSTMLASVYSVYNLIFISVNTFLGLINKGFDFILGQEYNRNQNNYVKIHDVYEALYMTLVFAVMTITCVLTIPFIRLYTGGVADIDYIDEYLPILFATIQVLSCSRVVSAKLITISNHAKNTVKNTVVEAILNLSFSIILVQKIGIYGVLYGTIIALLYRANDIIIYANKRILNRSPFYTYKNFGLNVVVYIIFLVVFSKIKIICSNYIILFFHAIWISVIVFGIYGALLFLINSKLRISVKKMLFNRFMSERKNEL